VDAKAFLKSAPRVLFILKETNDAAGIDLRQFLRECRRGDTWDNVARWAYTMRTLRCEIPWNEVAKISDDFRQEQLRYIAAINVKKTNGGHTSDHRCLKEFALRAGILPVRIVAAQRDRRRGVGAVLLLALDPGELASPVNLTGWESGLFQPIARPCRARRQRTGDIVKTLVRWREAAGGGSHGENSCRGRRLERPAGA
jgi:hypothetical protein